MITILQVLGTFSFAFILARVVYAGMISFERMK